MSSEVSSTKAALRRRLRTTRAGLDGAERARRARLLTEVLTAHIDARAAVAAYRPMPGEPDVDEFLQAHIARGGTVLLPRIAAAAEGRLEWVPWRPDTAMRRSGAFPIDEPVGDPVPLTADVLLVPALAVGRDGVRLGQGGGYYDRLLGPAAGPAEGPTADPGGGTSGVDGPAEGGELLAVVHAEELLEAGTIPAEPHDLRVGRAVTEDGVAELG